MNSYMHYMHPPKIVQKLDEGIVVIFVSEKNRPLLLAKGVDSRNSSTLPGLLKNTMLVWFIYDICQWFKNIWGGLFQ